MMNSLWHCQLFDQFEMSSHVKQICDSIYHEQVQSIRDLTSGHLNENHLYRPRRTINGVRKPSWSSSQKPHPTLRPPHRLQTYATNVEQMKETLVDFTYLTLPEIPRKKSQKSPRFDELRSSSSRTTTNEQLPPIINERIQIPAFSIDISEEQRVRKMKTFNDTVIQTNDVNLHGLGYSEDFVAYVEQNLLDKLTKLEIQSKRQTLSLTRLQAYSEAMGLLIEGSIAFGPVLERIKNEYELYLDFLLTTQPEYGTHIAEQLKRLRQGQPNFSLADSELFDIARIEQQTREALEKNKRLNEELKRVQQEQMQSKADAASARIIEIPSAPTEIKIKTQAEQIEEMRQNVFNLLDKMSYRKQELTEKFVPVSICTQLQQAVRDTEMDAMKINQQNETLFDEVQNIERKIREEILSHDQSEFADENVEQIIQLLKKVDVLHMKKSISGANDPDDRYFLHTYDDYFS